MSITTANTVFARDLKLKNLFRRRLGMMSAFWVGLFSLTIAVLLTAHPQYPESAVGAIAVIIPAWLPIYIWIRKGLGGLPIFPVFAITCTWTFGLPLLYEHPIVARFDAEDQLFAALSVMSFLLISTWVWYIVRRKKSAPPLSCLAIRESGADAIFFAILAGSVVFTIAMTGNWLVMDPGVFAIVRSVVLAVQALACFVLSFRLGSGDLYGVNTFIFKALLFALILVGLPGLIMINSMAVVALAAFGYVSGSGKVPWLSFAVGIMAFAFLHVGKADMRDHYWGDADQGPVQPAEYPAFFTEWISTSTANVIAGENKDETQQSSLVERASLMQLLLYEQTLSDQIPFMYGDTYSIVPMLLVPRVVFPAKPTTHEGTYRLNIHYGFQTREETVTTTIGFGLLNEAYANFGLAGIALLAIVSGAFYGVIERWASVVPLLSFRGLFSIIVASYSFQTEFAAGVYCAALFQSTIALIALSLFIMHSTRNPLAEASRIPSR
jgi:hypothetical protein